MCDVGCGHAAGACNSRASDACGYPESTFNAGTSDAITLQIAAVDFVSVQPQLTSNVKATVALLLALIGSLAQLRRNEQSLDLRRRQPPSEPALATNGELVSRQYDGCG